MKMEWHFVIPAVSFVVVTAVVAATGLIHSAPDAGQHNRFPAVFLIPGLLAAALAWFGERLIESWMSGSHGSIHFLLKGSTPSGQDVIPWVGLAYFAAMVVGMFAHTTWDAISKRRGGKSPAFDKWLYLRPALVAPIIFIAVLKLVGGSSFDFEALLLSFQNGFFWQTVLSKH
jgi:hypothetical protein